MLLKKIKKILCLISAVIIAICSCSVPVSAETVDNITDFSFTDIQFYAQLFIYDDAGNVIEEKTIAADNFVLNSAGDSLYIDISSSEYPKIFQPGCIALLGLWWDAPYIDVNSKYKIITFTFSKGVSVLDFDYSFGDFDVEQNGDSYSVGLDSGYFGCLLETDRNISTFSFVSTLQDFDSSNPSLSPPVVAPGIFNFLSNIGTFFTASVNWFTSILTDVIAEPSLTVLVLGILIVGFGFTLLIRLIKT